MKVRIRLFASLREEVGRERVDLEVPDGASVKALLAAFEEAYPEARSVGNVLVAVNQEIARPDVAVREDDEVALLPPVSGGSDLPRVVRTDFDLPTVLAELANPKDGAFVFFFGSVREDSGDRRVETLRYEVYADMADRTIRRIEGEAAEEEGADRVLVQHRVGDLGPGEKTILVAATAPHRGEAFAACRRALERVKAEAPVWKKEIYADGSASWVEPHGPEAGPED